MEVRETRERALASASAKKQHSATRLQPSPPALSPLCGLATPPLRRICEHYTRLSDHLRADAAHICDQCHRYTSFFASCPEV